MSRIRIAYVISTLSRSGPVNVLYGIVRELADSCDISIFTLAPEGEDTRIGDFRRFGIPVNCVVGGRVESMLRGRRRLAERFAKFKPNIIHAHGFRACVLCAKMPYAKVATVHNCIYEDYLTTYGRTQARWMTKEQIAALRKYNSVIACSESTGAYLREEFGLDVDVVRNGIDQSVYYPLVPDVKLAMRRSLGYSNYKTIVISTGGCSELKGTLPLIESFHVANKDRSAELHIFGKGPEYERCVSLGYCDVFLHGFVDDVAPHLQAADLFVSASWSEGMPLAVLEALSCGLPALLSDIAPHKEVSVACETQHCIVLFDAKEAFKAEGDFAGILASTIAHAKAPSDTKCFSNSAMAAGYHAIYIEVLGGFLYA